MTVRPDPAAPFYPRLEALRGVAALMVAAFHASQAQWHPGQMLLSPGAATGNGSGMGWRW